MRSGPSLAGVRLVIPDHAMGLPVLRALSLYRCCRHYPGAATGRRLRASRPAVSAFPDNVVGSTCTVLFVDCSAFARVAARTLARSPICDLLHRGLQPFCLLHDCSGCFRLERSPGGACTHWKAPPSHGAHAKADMAPGEFRSDLKSAGGLLTNRLGGAFTRSPSQGRDQDQEEDDGGPKEDAAIAVGGTKVSKI
jgi:hypothetical protein